MRVLPHVHGGGIGDAAETDVMSTHTHHDDDPIMYVQGYQKESGHTWRWIWEWAHKRRLCRRRSIWMRVETTGSDAAAAASAAGVFFVFVSLEHPVTGFNPPSRATQP